MTASFIITGFFIIVYSCSTTRKVVTPPVTIQPTVVEEVKPYVVPQNKPLRRTDDIWVWRSVLDLRSRVISIGLNDKLWVAYNTENASLYKNGLAELFLMALCIQRRMGRNLFQKAIHIS